MNDLSTSCSSGHPVQMQTLSVSHHKANNSCLKITAVAVAVLAITGCSRFSLPGNSGISDFEDDVIVSGNNFSKRVYASVGVGASNLNPDTTANATFDVNDSVRPAGQITAGVDLSKTFSVEVHSADLGSAGLSPSGRINYHLNGGSALMYVGGNREKRAGLTGYGRVGFGAMDNSAVGNVAFVRANDTQVLVGAGAEYGLRNGLGLRGEVIVFDKDAQFAQLGVVYRMGGGSGFSGGLAEAPMDSQIEVPAVAVNAPFQQPVFEQPAFEPPPLQAASPIDRDIDALAKYTSDSDEDGIFDTLDECPNSSIGVAIDENGCAVFDGVIEGVNFERGSAQLTVSARTILDNVIETLSNHPDALVAISAHTDSNGAEPDNMSLSRSRAITVAKYLINSGMPKNLMSARAFGELAPLTENNTPEGRALNRRVELVASKGIEQ